jgi:hypothetical protein
MSLNKLRQTFWAWALACLATSAFAGAASADVCQIRQGDPLAQLYIYDGKPSENVILAPDGDGALSNKYTVKPIYDKGGFVSVRCKYKGGVVVDLELKSKVTQCRFLKAKGGYGNLRCR